MPVPKVVDAVFQKIPLHVSASNAPDHEFSKRAAVLKAGVTSKAADNGTDYFKLCVYRLFQRDNLLLATDPVCLFVQLSIILKNQLQMPTQSDWCDNVDQIDENMILTVSYKAALDKQLPILLEDSNVASAKTYRRISRSNFVINQLNLSQIENSKDHILIEHMDTVFYDAWIYTLVSCLSDEEILQIYGDQNEESLQLLGTLGTKMLVSDLLPTLLKRNSFASRNPCITAKCTKWIPSVRSLLYLEDFASKLEKESEKVFEQFEFVLQKFPQSQDLGAKDLKLMSYVICIDKFMKGTKIYELVQKYNLLEYCESKLAAL